MLIQKSNLLFFWIYQPTLEGKASHHFCCLSSVMWDIISYMWSDPFV